MIEIWKKWRGVKASAARETTGGSESFGNGNCALLLGYVSEPSALNSAPVMFSGGFSQLRTSSSGSIPST